MKEIAGAEDSSGWRLQFQLALYDTDFVFCFLFFLCSLFSVFSCLPSLPLIVTFISSPVGQQHRRRELRQAGFIISCLNHHTDHGVIEGGISSVELNA